MSVAPITAIVVNYENAAAMPDDRSPVLPPAEQQQHDFLDILAKRINFWLDEGDTTSYGFYLPSAYQAAFMSESCSPLTDAGFTVTLEPESDQVTVSK